MTRRADIAPVFVSADVAAALEGRAGIGCEIDERYCEVAAKRLQEVERCLDTLPGRFLRAKEADHG